MRCASGANFSGVVPHLYWRAVRCPEVWSVPSGRGSGSVVAPTGWAEFIAPVQQRIDLKFYGFYIGELKAPSGQFDATFRATKFLSITPSYLYYSVPADGLNELANRSGGFTTLTRSTNFGSTGRLCSRSTQFRNLRAQHVLSEGFFQHTCMAESLFQQKRSIAIAIRSPSRIPSRSRATSGNLSPPTKPFTTREAGWTKKPSIRTWRHGAHRKACFFSALLHVGKHKRN